LASKAIEFFKNEFVEDDEKVVFNYIDKDGDVITFSTEEEWKSLLESLKEDEVLRVTCFFESTRTTCSFEKKKKNGDVEEKVEEMENVENGELIEKKKRSMEKL